MTPVPRHNVELEQAMTFVELSVGDEYLAAYEYARLSGVELHPIPNLAPSKDEPCPDTTALAESTTPANNADTPAEATPKEPTAE